MELLFRESRFVLSYLAIGWTNLFQSSIQILCALVIGTILGEKPVQNLWNCIAASWKYVCLYLLNTNKIISLC